MGDLASDHEAAIRLIIKEYRRLQAHDQEHELLEYIDAVTDDGFEINVKKDNEFLDRFETYEDKKSHTIKLAKVLTNYFFALKKAADKIEGIDTTPKKPADTTPVKSLDDLKYDHPDNGIPF